MNSFKLPEGRGQLTVNSFEDLAIVIDASESASTDSDVILKIATQLFDRLPAGISKRLFFLGNSKQYDYKKLAQSYKLWSKENSMRGSFISPNLEGLKAGKVIVIGSGLIYDLQDWVNCLLTPNLFFVTINESLRGDIPIGREVQRDQLFDLISDLSTPVATMEIGGFNFMPYYWSNGGYKLIVGDVNYLQGSNLEDYSISVSYFGSEVTAKHQGGLNEGCGLLTELEHCEMPQWFSLKMEEVSIFKQAIQGQSYECLHGNHRHNAGELICDGDGTTILGKPVYPTLNNKKGFVLIRCNESSAVYYWHPVNVIRLDFGSVAVAHGGHAFIYGYDPDKNRWVKQKKLPQYYPMGDQYLLVL